MSSGGGSAGVMLGDAKTKTRAGGEGSGEAQRSGRRRRAVKGVRSRGRAARRLQGWRRRRAGPHGLGARVAVGQGREKPGIPPSPGAARPRRRAGPAGAGPRGGGAESRRGPRGGAAAPGPEGGKGGQQAPGAPGPVYSCFVVDFYIIHQTWLSILLGFLINLAMGFSILSVFSGYQHLISCKLL